MYDRKTWIVVFACVMLLIANIYYSAKTKQRMDEEARKNPPPPAAAGLTENTPAANPAIPGPESAAPQPPKEEQTVTFETTGKEDAGVIYTFTTRGGGLKTAEIKDQKGVLGPVRLNHYGSKPVGTLAAGPDNFETGDYEYVTAESVPGKKAVFRGKNGDDIITKTWSLVEGGTASEYQLDFVLDVRNTGSAAYSLNKYSLFLGAAAPVGKNEKPEGTQTIYLDGGSLKTVGAGSFNTGILWWSQPKPLDTRTVGKLDFAGVADQFFATILHPVESGPSVVWSKMEEVNLGEKQVKAIRSGMNLPEISVPAGESRSYAYRVFAGPKVNRYLQKMEGEQKVGWGEVMNYGMWSPFSRFMNRALITIHGWIDGFTGKASWGLAVIFLTIVVRAAIWPLYNRSNRTAKRMAKLKPEMDKLKEKYPDDPTKVSQETMGLYRKYGINPLGSCLPMFAQLPIFIGFFSMLNHAVEMRGFGFLWVPDLAEPDTKWHLAGIPINPLPLVMVATSMIQMAMMPNTSADKTQATMMKLMPLMFLYIAYNSPAALALYWTTSNLFSILQTWLSNRLPEPELKPVKQKAGKGKSWMERMVEQAEAQKKAGGPGKMRQADGRVIESDETPKKRTPRTGG